MFPVAIRAEPLDRARPVEDDVGALTSGVTVVVNVLAGHPRFPVVERLDTVANDRAAEAFLARGLDPDQKAEVRCPLGTAGRDSLDDDDRGRLDRVPLGQGF